LPRERQVAIVQRIPGEGGKAPESSPGSRRRTRERAESFLQSLLLTALHWPVRPDDDRLQDFGTDTVPVINRCHVRLALASLVRMGGLEPPCARVNAHLGGKWRRLDEAISYGKMRTRIFYRGHCVPPCSREFAAQIRSHPPEFCLKQNSLWGFKC